MNWKKTGVLSILALIMLPLFLGFVSAATAWNEVKDTTTFFKWVSQFFAPVGMENDIIAVFLGALAMIITFAILLDVATIVLPFSSVTNYIIVGGLTIAAILLSVPRTIAGWGLAVGGIITGSAGGLAIVISAILLLVAIVGLFWTNSFIGRYVRHAKLMRKIEKKKEAGGEAAGDIAALEKEAAELIRARK